MKSRHLAVALLAAPLLIACGSGDDNSRAFDKEYAPIVEILKNVKIGDITRHDMDGAPGYLIGGEHTFIWSDFRGSVRSGSHVSSSTPDGSGFRRDVANYVGAAYAGPHAADKGDLKYTIDFNKMKGSGEVTNLKEFKVLFGTDRIKLDETAFEVNKGEGIATIDGKQRPGDSNKGEYFVRIGGKHDSEIVGEVNVNHYKMIFHGDETK